MRSSPMLLTAPVNTTLKLWSEDVGLVHQVKVSWLGVHLRFPLLPGAHARHFAVAQEVHHLSRENSDTCVVFHLLWDSVTNPVNIGWSQGHPLEYFYGVQNTNLHPALIVPS